MKKYRCPKCGETFEGELKECPKCNTPMHYRKKQEVKVEEEAKIVQRFNFEDPDVIKHDDKVPETPLIEDENEEKEPEAKAAPVAAPVQENVIKPNGESYFDGRLGQKIGWYIVAFLLSIVTVFIGVPWAVCLVYRWEIKHTIIQGHRMKFDGKGGQLLGRWLLWMLLSILTALIFTLWIPIFFKKWKVKHIMFAD